MAHRSPNRSGRPPQPVAGHFHFRVHCVTARLDLAPDEMSQNELLPPPVECGKELAGNQRSSCQREMKGHSQIAPFFGLIGAAIIGYACQPLVTSSRFDLGGPMDRSPLGTSMRGLKDRPDAPDLVLTPGSSPRKTLP